MERDGGQIQKAIERGVKYDHVRKVDRAKDGLVRHIEKIKNRLGHPRLPAKEQIALREELSTASRLLDKANRILPRR